MLEIAHRDALESGCRLHGHQIEAVLGRGGFGITYLAHDLNLERQVALKEYLPMELAVRDADQSVHSVSKHHEDQYRWGLQRFTDEARTLKRFDHPNILRVHSVFEANNTAYMVMDYEEGESLETVLSRPEAMDEERLLNIALALLEGLEVVHREGFIHRDIKPDNIYVRADGSPVLLDFGSARLAMVGRTRTVTTVVSSGYAPLEQYSSRSDEQGPWTDIYSLGATLYRAVAGEKPVDAVDRSRGILGSTREILVPATEMGRDRYSPGFLAAIDHALELVSAGARHRRTGIPLGEHGDAVGSRDATTIDVAGNGGWNRRRARPRLPRRLVAVGVNFLARSSIWTDYRQFAGSRRLAYRETPRPAIVRCGCARGGASAHRTRR